MQQSHQDISKGEWPMSHTEKKCGSLSNHVSETIDTYLKNIDGHKISNLYDLVLNEIEPALFKAVMKYVDNNQSKAAEILGISRGTLRKKLSKVHL